MDTTTATGQADSLTVACYCGAQIPRPRVGHPETCEGCSWQVVASASEHTPGDIFYINPGLAAALARPRWEAGAPRSYVRTVTYFTAEVTAYLPVSDPASSMYGGSQADEIGCDHRHQTPEAAERCAERTARREIARRNAVLDAADAVDAEGGE